MDVTKQEIETIHVSLNIPRERILAWYRGLVHTVQAYDREGRLVEFPIHILQPFMRESGIQGIYRIDYDQNGCFKRIVEC